MAFPSGLYVSGLPALPSTIYCHLGSGTDFHWLLLCPSVATMVRDIMMLTVPSFSLMTSEPPSVFLEATRWQHDLPKLCSPISYKSVLPGGSFFPWFVCKWCFLHPWSLQDVVQRARKAQGDPWNSALITSHHFPHIFWKCKLGQAGQFAVTSPPCNCWQSDVLAYFRVWFIACN